MSSITVEHRPPLRIVTLDTGKRNVLTLEAVESLAAALAPDPDSPVVVLRGRRDGFSCGLDNKALMEGGVRRETLLSAMGDLLVAAVRGPTRIVAACEGHAVAAGAMLLLVADVRLAIPGSYKIGFTEPRLGMPLPALPVLLARERLDRRRLHELTTLGRTVGPQEAAEVGFIDAVVEAEAFEAKIVAQAEDLSELTDAAYQGTKAAVWGSMIEGLETLARGQRDKRDAAAPR